MNYLDEFGRDISLRKQKVSASNIDEFGRDNSLREKLSKVYLEYEEASQYIRKKFEGKSWVDIQWESDDDDEVEEQQQVSEAYSYVDTMAEIHSSKSLQAPPAKKETSSGYVIDSLRKNLLLNGLYEAEDGEIFE